MSETAAQDLSRVSATAKPRYAIPLAGASAWLSQVGAKGAWLARMAAVGLPVPPGSHIATAAYRRFVTEHALQGSILPAVSAAKPDQPATLEYASSRIGELFAEHGMPDDIAQETQRAYADLGAYAGLGGGDAPVAVRSSATAENLPELSFAGQQETYARMQGEGMVLTPTDAAGIAVDGAGDWLISCSQRLIAFAWMADAESPIS